MRKYSLEEFSGFVKNAGFSIEQFKYLGVGSPIRIRTNNGEVQIIPQSVSKYLQRMHLDSVPLIQNLATYNLILARKT